MSVLKYRSGAMIEDLAIGDWETIDPAIAVKDMATPEEQEDEYGEEVHYWVFLNRSPLIPPELQP